MDVYRHLLLCCEQLFWWASRECFLKRWRTQCSLRHKLPWFCVLHLITSLTMYWHAQGARRWCCSWSNSILETLIYCFASIIKLIYTIGTFHVLLPCRSVPIYEAKWWPVLIRTITFTFIHVDETTVQQTYSAIVGWNGATPMWCRS